jgi:hypothetical protein
MCQGTRCRRDLDVMLCGYPLSVDGVASAVILATPGGYTMSDRLSDLQQFILAMAHFHRKYRFRDENTRTDVYGFEIVGARWGFRTTEGRRLRAWTKRTGHWPHFPKATLGLRYQAARVAVSKALRRLEQRGLGRRVQHAGDDGQHHLGFTLTMTGCTVARQVYPRFGPTWEAAETAEWLRR